MRKSLLPLTPTQRLIAYEARATIAVDDTTEVVAGINALALKPGGYIVNSSVEGSDGGSRIATVVFRVPSEKFESPSEKCST